MNTGEFLDYLKSLNIKLTVNGTKLKCSAPPGVLTSTLQAQIAERKADLLGFLQNISTLANSQTNHSTRNVAKERISSVLQQDQVNSSSIPPQNDFPLIIVSPGNNVSLCDWVTQHRQSLEAKILEHGAILFRNFNLNGIAEFEQFIKAIAGSTMAYSGESVGVTPRTPVHGNIYTSTEFSAKFKIALHNESSFAYTWPLKIFFYCIQPAPEGGETPIADSRNVLQQIPDSIKQRFLQRGVMYLRNYGIGSGPKWQQVFQTTNKSVVEEYCRSTDTTVEWQPGNRLRTRSFRPAIVKHPLTGDMVWFNNICQANVACLNASLKEAMLDAFKLEDLPRNSYYGDGSEIEPWVLNALQAAYQKEKVLFTWQKGDVLMLDNMLAAHGREPFVPPRKVVVGMANPVNRQSVGIISNLA
ncbi:MAG: TauD/TfdA family dioxygenase [Moorea sp. SIO1F2]|uniref:TauD/TfdA family dioxygenase n=1 Tax=Moorena sp. SIO1F2 TaxID=2607819 RepID=UPI0013B9CDBD|nr:TauD/TfdA family dioxygenase [Moorena sp. SIO1F2]NEO46357.1 TauD/TfdA family dioxygenase [Moorena sp. SIO4A3]NET84828.1 TauD/TfdA family dioxygenase [Moorena sp. SIO1F2]